jgi:hypothetical protein
MDQHNGLSMAAFRIDDAMVANLNYTALKTGGKPFQADQHGRQICHEYPPPFTARVANSSPQISADERC